VKKKKLKWTLNELRIQMALGLASPADLMSLVKDKSSDVNTQRHAAIGLKAKYPDIEWINDKLDEFLSGL